MKIAPNKIFLREKERELEGVDLAYFCEIRLVSDNCLTLKRRN
jgi:hypothetical protein